MAKHDDGKVRAADFVAATGTAASERARRVRLLRRVADALQVPESSLYDTVRGPLPPEDGSSATDEDRERQCAALLRAYRRIQDPAERRRLLELVQATAERG
ncbi:hypothetical protein ACLBX9_15445 [Methylobacterium sp. A49B]|uniref:Uncharacterized protein n=1 Tax=Methylobacterium mesophilicum SR1.6/6 TaxID=908290 RepID=A0A6B9FK39_9HYPH|nr:hypothetical protein [Methylobacterium mesophilicum]QGY02329.1 hypothetical protein MMSR116_10905 [Methylobacterium mesophilicum SR1.6/6]